MAKPQRKKITSKAQWGYLWANNPKVAKRMADYTIGTKKPGTKKGKKIFSNLPSKKKKGGKRKK